LLLTFDKLKKKLILVSIYMPLFVDLNLKSLKYRWFFGLLTSFKARSIYEFSHAMDDSLAVCNQSLLKDDSTHYATMSP